MAFLPKIGDKPSDEEQTSLFTKSTKPKSQPKETTDSLSKKSKEHTDAITDAKKMASAARENREKITKNKLTLDDLEDIESGKLLPPISAMAPKHEYTSKKLHDDDGDNILDSLISSVKKNMSLTPSTKSSTLSKKRFLPPLGKGGKKTKKLHKKNKTRKAKNHRQHRRSSKK